MAMLAMLRSPPAAAAVVAAGKAAAATMAAGKAAEAAATEEVDVGGKHVRGGKGTNEVGGGSTAAAGGDSSSAKAAEGSTPEARCYRCGKKGHWRADCTELCSRCQGRGHTADVWPVSAEKRCNRCKGLLIYAPRRRRKLCLRCRTTIVMMVRSRASIHMTPSAMCMISYR